MQVPTSTQKKDGKNNEEKEGPGTSSQEEFGSSKTPDLTIRPDEEEAPNINLVAELDEDSDTESNDEHDVGLEAPSTHESLFDNKIIQENGQISDVNKNVIESKNADRVSKSEVSSNAGRLQFVSMPLDIVKDEEPRWTNSIKINDLQEKVTEGDTESIKDAVGHVGSIKTTYDSYRGSSSVKPEPVDDSYSSSISEQKKKEVEFLKLKLESEESLRKETIDRLADDNFKKGNKLFYYPELVQPDQNIEIFFNRSFSTLKNEPDVMIMGAFNDWKWKSFSMKLSKGHLKGDWWSCEVYVPKEAYKIDFVFYNGKDVYENNDKQDFCISVEGGMDVFDFENFLLEEKLREQDELLRHKAEKERQEEEQRRIEAERVASEADRAQAAEEAAKTRQTIQHLMKKAMTSVDNVWYIEPKPRDIEGNDVVRLYYNRSSGPLSHATDLWIHGGHNNWTDGLSIVSKLIKSEKDGDWWFVDGTLWITSESHLL